MSAGSANGTSQAATLTPKLRDRLIEIADQLIPADGEMPAASEVGVADTQLAVVVDARPDLVDPLLRVLSVPGAGMSALDFLNAIESTDPEGHEALVLTVVGGYYMSPQVVRLLGYSGQHASPLNPDIYPAYVAEGLLDAVIDRGPLFRPAPD